MKIFTTLSLKLILLTCILSAVTLSAQAQLTNYASIPYYQGFETGVMDSNWYTTSSVAGGRIQIWDSGVLTWTTYTANAYAGTKFLGMDMPGSATFNLNEAWMGLNTTGASSLFLSFWWSDWNDETHPEDGIFISDNGGTSFTKVLDLLGDNNPDLNWVFFNLNLDSINTVHGLNYGPNYVIKFQQYDDYYFAGGNDGFLFDEINVGELVTPTNTLHAHTISVYPNPFNDHLTISNFNEGKSVTVNVYNTLGQQVVSKHFAAFEPLQLNLNIDAGMYTLELISDNKRAVKQIVKK